LIVFITKIVVTALFSLLIWKGASAETFWQKLQTKYSGQNWVLLGIVLFRLLPFVGVYLLLNQTPRGDVPFFWSKAQDAYQGKLVYRDFLSYHAPLFSYVIALPLVFWYSSKAIVLLMVMIESALVYSTYLFYDKNGRADALKSAILYLLLPGPLVMVLLGGQEDIWFWGVALLMLWYLVKYRQDGAGMGFIFSTGLLFIKVTFVFWLFPLWIIIKQRFGFLVGLAAVGILSLGLLYWLTDWAFLMPLQMTENLLSPNLYTISRPFIAWLLGHSPKLTLFSWGGLVCTILATTLLAWRLKDTPLSKSLPLIFILTYALMTVLMPTSPGYYAFTYLLPFVFEVVAWRKKRELALLLVLNALLVVQPFLFTYLQSPNYEDFIMFKKPLYALEYALQVVNVVAFGWLVFITFRKVQSVQ
jgi:hypothetical protein